jgi:hypothetical protein
VCWAAICSGRTLTRKSNARTWIEARSAVPPSECFTPSARLLLVALAPCFARHFVTVVDEPNLEPIS